MRRIQSPSYLPVSLLDIPGLFPGWVIPRGGISQFYHFLTLLVKTPRESPYGPDPPLRRERAAQDLEGGLETVPEGLEGFNIPCVEVLSVAGFFAQTSPFLAGRRFILRGERAPFVREDPPLFNILIKSVKLAGR